MWESPPTNFYKLNIDAALFFNLEKVDYGAIVLDYRGTTLLATSVAEFHVTQPEAIEALSIFRGLQLCMHQGLENLIIESDCLLVVEEILKQ